MTVWTLLLAAYLANSFYLYAASGASFLYAVVFAAHVLAGLCAAPFLVVWSARRLRPGGWAGASAICLLLGVLFGLAALVLGGFGRAEPFAAVHFALTGAGAVLHLIAARSAPFALVRWGAVSAAAFFGLAALMIPQLPDDSERIVNPPLPPVDMAGENSRGEESLFFPSAVETADGKPIPSDFFMSSERCGEKGCHPDIFEQWSGSMHRFSSFNNQWYRRSITYMQETTGEIESSK